MSAANMLTDTKIPWGVSLLRLFSRFGPRNPRIQLQLYRIFILVITFLSYVCYHMSRKPISVVKPELLKCPNDTVTALKTQSTLISTGQVREEDLNCKSFITEMNNTDSNTAHDYLGFMDTSFLASYAIFMFVSGFVAERVNLRYFLSIGMILSGLFTILFGLGRYMGVHTIYYYLAMQFLGGAVQSSGWPGVVTVVANWFGKGKKGFVFGVWNAHTSIGNIVGGLLAGKFVDTDWGLSFVVPGAIIAAMGVCVWFVLPVQPSDLGFDQELLLTNEGRYCRLEQPQVSSSSRRRNGYNTLQSTQYNTDGATPLLSPSSPSSSGESTPLLGGSVSDAEVESGLQDENANRPEIQSERPAVPEKAITFLSGWKIPGVAEFALSLFFCKLVSYTFLYWLPTFIYDNGIGVTSEDAAYFATLFDVGGIVGGVIAGIASDRTGRPATACAAMVILAIPAMWSYNYYGQQCPLVMGQEVQNGCYGGHIVLLMVAGLLVNGPYALITTAVSAELGTHKSLKGSSKALATVTSIIDGTGSVGAAVGPYLAAALQGSGSNANVFYMLMAADVLSLLFLSRLVISEVVSYWSPRRSESVSNQNTQSESLLVPDSQGMAI